MQSPRFSNTRLLARLKRAVPYGEVSEVKGYNCQLIVLGMPCWQLLLS